MAGILKIVGTPIGNLGDLSPRAKESLDEAAIILAEDTRQTIKLVDGQKHLISCNQQNELSRLRVVQERLDAGDDVALVSDAGAPALSDPGSRLIDAVIQNGYGIEVIPGPTALTAAVMGCGLDMTRFVFLGFLPRKGKERQTLIESSFSQGFSLVIYEAANRVSDTLQDLAGLCGSARYVVARELTKRFETFHRGDLGTENMNPPFVDKGECVIVVEGSQSGKGSDKAELIQKLVGLMDDDTLSQKDVTKTLQEDFGLKRQEAYKLALKFRN